MLNADESRLKKKVCLKNPKRITDDQNLYKSKQAYGILKGRTACQKSILCQNSYLHFCQPSLLNRIEV